MEGVPAGYNGRKLMNFYIVNKYNMYVCGYYNGRCLNMSRRRDQGSPEAGDSPVSAAPDGAEVVHALVSAAHIIERMVNAELARQGLQNGWSGPRLRLMLAVEKAGRLRMGELTGKLGITARAVTTLVDGLEKEGLLLRKPDPGDRRATLLEVTDEARSQFERIRAVQREVSARIAGALSRAERKRLYELLQTLIAASASETEASP
jgi:DNA-binding MarR family transcriptional regulator